jgi:uncharacterized membrane protein
VSSDKAMRDGEGLACVGCFLMALFVVSWFNNSVTSVVWFAFWSGILVFVFGSSYYYYSKRKGM